MDKPYISVVIMAFKRKNFIERAIKSVLNQDMKKSKYEIILIKGFKDKKIDAFIKKHNIKNIYNPDQKVGIRLLSALSEIKGEVIAFLDDDDEFESNKLNLVYKHFKKNPNLIFYHNSYSIIKEDEEMINNNVCNNKTKSSILLTSNNKIKYLNYILHKLHSQENNSSMTVRKKLLEMNPDYLKKIGVSFDVFLFLISLIDDGEMLIDKKALTRYRFHSQGQVTQGKLDTFQNFWSHRRKYTKKAYKETLFLYHIAENTRFESMARLNLFETKIHYSLFNIPKDSKSFLPDIGDYFYFIVKKHSKSSISLVLQSIASKIFKTKIVKLIFTHNINKQKSEPVNNKII